MAATATAAQELPTAESYDVNFDRNTKRTRTDRMLSSLNMGGNTVEVDNTQLMYHDLTDRYLVVRPGQTVTPLFGYSGAWMQGYVYIDLDRNGRFDVAQPGEHGELGEGNELMCFAGMTLGAGLYNSEGEELGNLSAVQPPQFTIPEDLEPGYYMMRWKVDWDNCDPAGRVDEKNSIINNGGAIADVLLLVTAEPVVGAYQLVFADEFNQADGSLPDETKWGVSVRRKSVWNRWISDSPEVAFIEGGHLVCRAIPNPDTQTDNVPMLTGAIETRDRFAFTYGKVEVRLRTEPYSGNFPAAWMMPQPPCETWPNSGEVDIFEAIDAQNTSYHTIHSHWSYDLGQKNNPKSSFTKSVNVGQWHVYGLEWTSDRLVFYVDGAAVGTYARSSDENALAQGQWPFTHPFYLILNQSVGNGSWAKAADTSHTYETRFDYVRVYQLAMTDGIESIDNEQELKMDNAWTAPDGRKVVNGKWLNGNYYDLSGRRVTNRQTLPKGIYLRDGRKVIVR